MKKSAQLFFENLIDLHSPSGYEADASKLFKSYVEEHCDEVYADTIGNTIAVVKSRKPNNFNVMISAHIDEIGLMVRHIDEKGFIYFAAIGGIDVRLLLGSRVTIHTSRAKVRGVIGQKPIHLMEEADRNKVQKIHELFIDIGAKDKKDAAKLVEIGDPITIVGGLERLMNGLLVGRGFDDRMGVFCLAELTKELYAIKDELEVNVHLVASVQEEIGLRGAKVSAYNIRPNVGIALDVGFATDFPSIDPRQVGESKLGGGPIVARGPNINRKLYELIAKVAKKGKIEYQLHGEPRGTGTDANVMQLSRGGVATALISVPLRYMHTNVEVLDEKDLENTVKLLKASVLALKPTMDFRPF